LNGLPQFSARRHISAIRRKDVHHLFTAPYHGVWLETMKNTKRSDAQTHGRKARQAATGTGLMEIPVSRGAEARRLLLSDGGKMEVVLFRRRALVAHNVSQHGVLFQKR
jgi:hypothetical protein